MFDRTLYASALCLGLGLGGWAAPALAQPKLPRAMRVHNHLTRAARYQRADLQHRVAHELLAALAADPSRHEPWVRLVDYWRDQRRTLVREAYLRNPDHALVRLVARNALGRLPEPRKFGRAATLALFYPARTPHDLSRDHRVSVQVGTTLDRRLLVARGIDANGDVVPVDLVLTGEGGLEPDGEGGLVARRPSREATLVARDRKTGTTARLPIRIVGPIARVEVSVSRGAGLRALHPGQMLHLRARLYDALGQRLWSQRLAWLARTPTGEPIPGLLARGYSLMHVDEAYEPHVNSLIARKPPTYTGPIVLTIIAPSTGARRTLTVEASGKRVATPAREVPGWTWLTERRAAFAEARRTNKPVLLYYYARWCGQCTRIERTTLRNPFVVELSKQFAALRLDSDYHTTDVMMHGVRDFPSLMFFAPTGTFLGHVDPRDRFDAARLVAAMNAALKRSPREVARERELRDALAREPRSIEKLDALSRFLRRGHRWEDGYPVALRGFRLAQETARPDADRRLTEMLYYDLKLRQFDRADRAIETFVQQFPKSPHRERVEYYRGLRLFYGSGDLDAAEKAWTEQLEKYPRGRWNAKGRKMLRRARGLQDDRKRLGKDFPSDWNSGKGQEAR